MTTDRPMTRQLDVFADRLAQSAGTADDGNVRHAARSIGKLPVSGNDMLQSLRRELGWQAR